MDRETVNEQYIDKLADYLTPRPRINGYCALLRAVTGHEVQADRIPGERQTEFMAGIDEQLQRLDNTRFNLNDLTVRERRVLQLRFGLEDGRSHTLEEVGKEFEVTRERIRQIEVKALRKLRYLDRGFRTNFQVLSPVSLGRQVWGAVFAKDLPSTEGFEFDLNLNEEAQSFLPIGQETVPLYLGELLRRECGEIPDHIKEQIRAEFERVSQETRQKREQELRKTVLVNNRLLAGFDIDPDRLVELAQTAGDLLALKREDLRKIPNFGLENIRQLGNRLEELLQGETSYPPGFLGVFFMMHWPRRTPRLPKPTDLLEEEPENVLLPEIDLSREQLDSLNSLMLVSTASPLRPLTRIYRHLWDAGVYTVGNLLACTRQELFTSVSAFVLRAESAERFSYALAVSMGFSGEPASRIVTLLMDDYHRYYLQLPHA